MQLKGSCHCQAVTFKVESKTFYPFMYCYCSICRKTAGGGGYAINIMAEAESLIVKGRRNISVYRAILGTDQHDKPIRSEGMRHFCRDCGSCLWIYDKRWAKWVYPFASAIDTPLPKAPERMHIMLDYAAPWCRIKKGKLDLHAHTYPRVSILGWHKRHKLLSKK